MKGRQGGGRGGLESLRERLWSLPSQLGEGGRYYEVGRQEEVRGRRQAPGCN